MSHWHFGHSAVALPSGAVLIAGGNNSGGAPVSEIYSPTTGKFTNTGSMTTYRQAQGATLLNDGTVLIAGGLQIGVQNTYLASAELYNPSSGAFTTIGTLNTAWEAPLTLLVGGAILVAGGANASGILLSSENYRSGMAYPKYVVVGVTYAPPGSASSVSYSNSTSFGTSSTMSSSFTNAKKFGVSVGFGTDSLFGLTPDGSITGSFSTSWSTESDSSKSYTVNKTTTDGISVGGPTSSALGLYHDADVVWIWLNPITTFTSLPNSNLVWTGNAYDLRDPVGRMDIYGLYVAYLNGDAAIPPNVSSVLARSWAPNLVDGSGPGLTSTDLLNIAKADPFWDCVPSPSKCPTTVDSTRFSPNSSTNIQFVPPAQPTDPPITQTGSIVTQTITGSAEGGQDQRVVGYAIDVKASGGFLVDFNVDINYSQDFTWLNKWSSTSMNTVGQTSSFSVTGPAYSDHYTGPTQFNVYEDSVYGTFMFFPCAGSC
jgi:hypothetical protein